MGLTETVNGSEDYNSEDFEHFVKELSGALPVNTETRDVEKVKITEEIDKGYSKDVEIQEVSLNEDLDIEITTSNGETMVEADWATIIIKDEINQVFNNAILSPDSPLTKKRKLALLYALFGSPSPTEQLEKVLRSIASLILS